LGNNSCAITLVSNYTRAQEKYKLLLRLLVVCGGEQQTSGFVVSVLLPNKFNFASGYYKGGADSCLNVRVSVLRREG